MILHQKVNIMSFHSSTDLGRFLIRRTLEAGANPTRSAQLADHPDC